MARDAGFYLRKLVRSIRPASEPELVEVVDLPIPPGRDQLIPRQVFQRAKDRLVHLKHFTAIQRVREANSDLGFFLFDNDQADEYMAKHWSTHPIFAVYQRTLFGQMKADIFRYCVVYDQGGYYLDSNKGIGVAFTSLHEPDARGLVSYESNMSLHFPREQVASQLENPFMLLMQWSFGFAPQHPFLRQLVDRIAETAPYFDNRVFARPKDAIVALTGPGMFTSVFRDFVSEHGVAGIAEAGVDYHGQGIFRLDGSKLRDKKAGVNYAQIREAKIMGDTN